MDFIGRRLAIVINSAVFLIGAVILAFAPSFAILVGSISHIMFLLFSYYTQVNCLQKFCTKYLPLMKMTHDSRLLVVLLLGLECPCLPLLSASTSQR